MAVSQEIDRLRERWRDLSLRTKLLLFAVALVTVPGGVFAVVAFSGARAGLEREVGIQLQQTAERGAEAIAVTLARAEREVRSWAEQDVMRDLMVADLDKRVSKFLRIVSGDRSTYVAVLGADPAGTIVAASSGEWIGRNVADWAAMAALTSRDSAVVGPLTVPAVGEVLQIGVAIRNPDQPGGRIGSLLVLYDWRSLSAVVAGIRAKLTELGKRVAVLVVNGDGRVIGGVDFDGEAADRSPLAARRWERPLAGGYARETVPTAEGRPQSVLAGVARIAGAFSEWSVLVLERTDTALAPVRAMRTYWLIISTAILGAALAIASWLARSFMRPLDEVTRATSRVASSPQADLPLLPVRSRDEVGQLAESFNTMTVELKRSQEEALSAAKFAFAGELAAMVAHEVRTPLSVMRASAQMLAHPAPQRAAENAELVDTIIAEVDRVERVVTALIELARPLEQRLEPTPVRDILRRAADFTAAHAGRQHVHISCECGSGDPPALCDPEQMYQVVLNLVVNAVQALSMGGHVWLRTLSVANGAVGFEVADDGPGVPPTLRDRLFRPFVTGREDGTGLGLAFVERVVKAHRGTVAMRNGADGGAVFEVRLPVAGQG